MLGVADAAARYNVPIAQAKAGEKLGIEVYAIPSFGHALPSAANIMACFAGTATPPWLMCGRRRRPNVC